MKQSVNIRISSPGMANTEFRRYIAEGGDVAECAEKAKKMAAKEAGRGKAISAHDMRWPTPEELKTWRDPKSGKNPVRVLSDDARTDEDHEPELTRGVPASTIDLPWDDMLELARTLGIKSFRMKRAELAKAIDAA